VLLAAKVFRESKELLEARVFKVFRVQLDHKEWLVLPVLKEQPGQPDLRVQQVQQVQIVR
jgi:hypothetical protein